MQFSNADNEYDAAREWEVSDDNEDDINHDTWTSCEFCGTRMQHFLHICNKHNGYTKIIGKQCYENICFLTYGLEPPQRSGGGSSFLTGRIKQLYKDMPFDFVSWKNWFVERADKLPDKLKPSVAALKRFEILPVYYLEMFIEHYDNHREFDRNVLLPTPLKTPYRPWVPEYLTINQARRYRDNHSSIMAYVRAAGESEQAKIYYRLLCRAFAWATESSIEDFRTHIGEDMHKSETYINLVWSFGWFFYDDEDDPREEETKRLIESSFEQRIALDPNNAETHFQMGIVYESIMWNDQKAILSYQKAIELNPLHLGAIHSLALMSGERNGVGREPIQLPSLYHQQLMGHWR